MRARYRLAPIAVLTLGELSWGYPWSLDLGSERGSRGEKPPCARRRGNREKAHYEHPVVGPTGPRRAPVRSVGRHEGLHVRQGKRGGPVLWCVAAGSLDGPRHPRTRLHGRADRPRRLALAAGAHGGGRRGPGDREPHVHLGARQVWRDHADHHERPMRPGVVKMPTPIMLPTTSIVQENRPKALRSSSLNVYIPFTL